MKVSPKSTPMQQVMAEIRAEVPALQAAVLSPLPLFITGALSFWAGHHTGQSIPLTLTYTLFAYLISLLAVIDLRHGILPHILTGTLLTLGTFLAPTLGLSYWESSLGAFLAFTGLGLCAFLAERLSGQPSLGGGDLWLILGLGAWLGVGNLPMLLVSVAVTGIVSVVISKKISGSSQFPFGPALCAAGWLALLYGPYYWKFMELVTFTAS